MANCAKCGKELKGFFEKRDRTGQHIPDDYFNQKLCSDCDSHFKGIFEKKLLEEMQKRDEEIMRRKKQEQQQERERIMNTFRMPFEQAKAQGREIANIHYRTLPQANYIQHYINLYSEIAEEYGFKYKSHSQYPSYMGVVQFIELDFVFEKIPEQPKQTQTIQVVLDFTSLKDVMSKGGIVMTTYKCPNCNGMVNLPEEGKVLMCQYCGTPIKPIDIFEKIKSLIQ